MTNLDDYDLGPSVLAMGKFDGVHIGHQKLLQAAVDLAKQLRVRSVALTFDRHPLSVLSPGDAPVPLTGESEKRHLIQKMGIDALLILPFTQEFAALAANTYLIDLCKKLQAVAIVSGRDFRFGQGAGGDAALIERMAGELGYRAVIVEPACVDGQAVSSTSIRSLIAANDLSLARKMLGRPIE